LPRRGAPRNDNAKTWGMPDGSAGLPRRCAPRNDKGGEWGARWGDAGFRAYHLVLSLRARLGRGNQVSSLLCHCEEGLEEN
jgi:hypothetical protein